VILHLDVVTCADVLSLQPLAKGFPDANAFACSYQGQKIQGSVSAPLVAAIPLPSVGADFGKHREMDASHQANFGPASPSC
jgi:hypothetical protein